MKSLRPNPRTGSVLAVAVVCLAACQHPADVRTRSAPSPDARAAAAASALGLASSSGFEAARAALGAEVQGFREPQTSGAEQEQRVDASLLALSGPEAEALREVLRARMQPGGGAR